MLPLLRNSHRLPIGLLLLLIGCQSSQLEITNPITDTNDDANRLIGTWSVYEVRYQSPRDSFLKPPSVQYGQLISNRLSHNTEIIFRADGTARMSLRQPTIPKPRLEYEARDKRLTVEDYGHYLVRRDNGATWLKLSETSKQYGRLAFSGDTVRWYAPDNQMYYAAVRVK